MDKIESYFRLFDLKPGASSQDLKKAYKRLAKQWHPDRFANDPTVSEVAEEKIKVINIAYEELKSHLETGCSPSSSHRTVTGVRKRKTSPQEYFIRAKELAKKGYYQEAAEELGSAVKLDPKYAKAHHFRGILFTVQGFEYRGNSSLSKAAALGITMIDYDNEIVSLVKENEDFECFWRLLKVRPKEKASPCQQTTSSGKPKLNAKISLDFTFKDRLGKIQALAISHNLKTLVIGKADGSIELWNFKSRRKFFEFEGHTGKITNLLYGGKSQVLISSSDDGTIRFWDVSNGSFVQTISAHKGTITTFDICQARKLIATSGSDGTVQLWGLKDGRPISQVLNYETSVQTVLLSSAGDMVICGTEDGSVHFCSTLGIGSKKRVDGHTSSVSSLAYSSERQQFASGAANGEVCLWTRPDHQILFQPAQYKVNTLAFCKDGQIVCGADDLGNLMLWDTSSGSLLDIAAAHNDSVSQLLVIADDTVLSTGADGIVNQWKIIVG